MRRASPDAHSHTHADTHIHQAVLDVKAVRNVLLLDALNQDILGFFVYMSEPIYPASLETLRTPYLLR